MVESEQLLGCDVTDVLPLLEVLLALISLRVEKNYTQLNDPESWVGRCSESHGGCS